MQKTSTSVVYTNVTKNGKPITRTRTIKCPVAFVSKKDAEWVMQLGVAAKITMNHVLGILRDKFFDPMTIIAGGKEQVITMFDLFNSKSGLEGPFVYNGNTTCESIVENPVRELLNPKCPLIGVTTKDIIHFMETQLPDGVYVPGKFVKEAVYKQVQGTVRGAVTKKLNQEKGKAKKDKTWQKCCSKAAEVHTKTDDAAKELSLQMRIVGVQIYAMNNAGTPQIDEWPKECDVPKPEINEAFIAAYKDAIALFKTAFVEAFPEIRSQSLLYCPLFKLDWGTRDTAKFYDIQGKITGIPNIENKKRYYVKVYIRTVSGHSDNYFPKDLQESLGNESVLGIKFPEVITPEDITSVDGVRKTKCNTLGHLSVTCPHMKTKFNADGISTDDGVGIDLNVASFFMNTTIKMDETDGAVDWPEAVNEFRSQNPTAYPFTMPYPRSVKDLNLIADNVKEKDRLLRVIPLVGLRDGKPSDEKHGWKTSPDPLSMLFTWMLKRTDNNGNPFYSDEQRAHIGHTRDYRKLIRSDTANRLHYFHEQSKWDLSHDCKVNPFSESEQGQALLAERRSIQNRIEKEFVRLVVTGLFSVVKPERIAYLKMENVDLSQIKDNNKPKSLYMTAHDVWGMDNGKLSSKKNKVEFITEVQYDLRAISSTEYWNVISVTHDGDTVVVNAEPTDKWREESARYWIDAYTHRALHFSSVKHLIEELCIKRCIHFVLIDPAHTSQLCHVCRSVEHINFKGSDTEKLSREECLSKHVNFRYGRTFVCGNPECYMCGKEQDSDDNGAWNVLLPQIVIKRKRVKKSKS